MSSKIMRAIGAAEVDRFIGKTLQHGYIRTVFHLQDRITLSSIPEEEISTQFRRRKELRSARSF